MSREDNKTRRQKLLLWLNRLNFSVQLKRKGWRTQVVIPERFRSLGRLIKIFLTIVGLFSAFFAFQSSIVAFLFGLAVYSILSGIERILFSYTNLFVQPMPDFEIENEKWLGAFFGFAQQEGNRHEIPVVGMILADQDYARKIFEILLAWTNNRRNDEDHHVCVSAVVMDEDSYILFVYPSIHRRPAEGFFEAAEADRRKSTPNDVPLRMFAQLILGKRCLITADSYFPTFRNRYKPEVPFLFRLGIPGPNGDVDQLDGVEDFVFYELKIINRDDLTRKDLEYDMVRILGD